MPGPFSSRSFAATLPNSIAARYRKQLQKHPFLLFGLPFMATIVTGSFMLTPATALRYERYDRKNQQITQEQAMGLRGERRKVNMKDEYYVSAYSWYYKSSVVAVANNRAEVTSKRPRRLGAAPCQATTRRARWHTCIKTGQMYDTKHWAWRYRRLEHMKKCTIHVYCRDQFQSKCSALSTRRLHSEAVLWQRVS
jgi:cytochrome c oxidase assembly protein subunit 16